MSSIIYEEPDLMVNVRSSTAEDRGESLEEQDNLYENIDANTGHPVHLSAQDRELHSENLLAAVQRNPFRVIGLILGLLLLVGLTVLYRHQHMTVFWKEKQLKIKNENLTSELERMNCRFGKETQTQGNTTEWKRFQCSCYYVSTERKNWTESRNECKKNGADLVMLKTKMKHDFYKELNKHGEFWIGLESKENIKDWSKDRSKEWKWVDGSSLIYSNWKTGVNSKPESDSKVYMDGQGAWIPINSGAKHWICEKDIYSEFPGDLSV